MSAPAYRPHGGIFPINSARLVLQLQSVNSSCCPCVAHVEMSLDNAGDLLVICGWG